MALIRSVMLHVILIILAASKQIICKRSLQVAIIEGKCVFIKSTAEDSLKAECVNFVYFNPINTQEKMIARLRGS